MPALAGAQTRAALTGRILDGATGAPIAAATVTVESTTLGVLSDSTGRYRITRAPPGPQVLVVERLGYATARVSITVPTAGVLARDVVLATRALELPSVTVTADATGRARGELGTASVIDRDAIAVQSAISLSGILELVPGVELKPPGLGGVQQFALRTVPTSGVSDIVVGGPSAGDLASFGTLILLDGIPLSNNANLQTTGPRGETAVRSSARGGIDLRRIPASTLERVEVVRGIPSARFGDLTQGVIVVDTRAGAFAPEARAQLDGSTAAGSFAGGWRLRGDDALALNADVTRSLVAPGFRPDEAMRFAAQVSHRAERGGTDADGSVRAARLTLDSRLDVYQVHEDSPEDSIVSPGVASSNRDRGVRLSERLRAPWGDGRFEATASVDYTAQRSTQRSPKSRGAMPFTDRVDEGRAFGRYIGGEYSGAFSLDGDVWLLYARFEAERPAAWLGFDHQVRSGLELRREWNAGPGYQFAIEFPPQSSFNGVQGFDRSRRFDDIPAMATSALYLGDRVLHVFPGDVAVELQVGLRLDVLHDGEWWVSGARAAVLQPRVNLQVSPWPWLRARAGAGRTAKVPNVGQLYPAPQFYDVVNVNWFAPAPVERLAVLTTFVRDPSNAELGFARATKAEAGVELTTTSGDAGLAVVAFRDRTNGGIGFQQTPGFLLRDRYALADSVIGDGRPTTILEPPTHADTVPILLDVPANNLTLETSGFEVTARLPELRALRTRLEVSGAWIDTDMFKEGLDFGLRFRDFQLDERIPRAPYWEAVRFTGTRALLTYRLVHHQPELGLVITGTLQHFVKEQRQNVAGVDTLAFAGYITRAGELVVVAPEARSAPEFQDLRQPRANTLVNRSIVQPDWLLSIQASLELPLGGRLSFYAFNALDRVGRLGETARIARFFPDLRFGLEGSLPLSGVADAVGRALSPEP